MDEDEQRRLVRTTMKVREAIIEYVVGCPDREAALNGMVAMLNQEAKLYGTNEDIRECLLNPIGSVPRTG